MGWFFMSTIRAIRKTGLTIGRKTVKGTLKMAHLGKLTIDLNVAKAEQRKLFKEIGEHVHIGKIDSVHTSPKVKVLLDKIAICDARIRKLVKKINDVKRLNSCDYCGAVIDADAKYCPKCSRPQKRHL